MSWARPGLLARLARSLLGRGGLAPVGGDSLIPARERFRVVSDDLLREYTREEVEHHERAVDPLGGVAPVPFGHLNAVWQHFCSALQPGDRIWRFNAQRVAANGEAVIRSGYVALRAGEPQRPLVATFRTVGPDVALAPLAASTEPVTTELVAPPRPSVGPLRSAEMAAALSTALSTEISADVDTAIAGATAGPAFPGASPAAAAPAASAALRSGPTDPSVKQTEGGANTANARHREPVTVE